MFQSFAAVLVRNREYAEKYRALGVPSERIRITGNIKHDIKTDFDPAEMRKLYRQNVGASDSDIVLVAGSTDRGEEGIVLDAVVRMGKDIKVVIAPRHLERLDEVDAVVRKFGRNPVRMSNPVAAENPVFILDTMGELFKLYSAGDVVFVGGSFTDRGGQNVIEPAVLGRAIILGPNHWNFKEEVDGLNRLNAITIAASPDALPSAISETLAKGTEMGKRAQAYVESSRGATAKTLEEISKHLA